MSVRFVCKKDYLCMAILTGESRIYPGQEALFYVKPVMLSLEAWPRPRGKNDGLGLDGRGLGFDDRGLGLGFGLVTFGLGLGLVTFGLGLVCLASLLEALFEAGVRLRY
jgi:hypothetical protein